MSVLERIIGRQFSILARSLPTFCMSFSLDDLFHGASLPVLEL